MPSPYDELFTAIIDALPAKARPKCQELLAKLNELPTVPNPPLSHWALKRANERFTITGDDGSSEELKGWPALMEYTGFTESSLRVRFSNGQGEFGVIRPDPIHRNPMRYVIKRHKF